MGIPCCSISWSHHLFRSGPLFSQIITWPELHVAHVDIAAEEYSNAADNVPFRCTTKSSAEASRSAAAALWLMLLSRVLIRNSLVALWLCWKLYLLDFFLYIVAAVMQFNQHLFTLAVVNLADLQRARITDSEWRVWLSHSVNLFLEEDFDSDTILLLRTSGPDTVRNVQVQDVVLLRTVTVYVNKVSWVADSFKVFTMKYSEFSVEKSSQFIQTCYMTR